MVLKTKSCNLLTVPSKSSPRDAMVTDCEQVYRWFRYTVELARLVWDKADVAVGSRFDVVVVDSVILGSDRWGRSKKS